MEPFHPIDLPPEYKSVAAYMTSFGIGEEEATQMRDLMAKEQFFVNGTYQVNVSYVKSPMGKMLHISVKRLDNSAIVGWDDLQSIKNMFVGPECEGVEIFPAESRLVNCANQRHLWCFIDPDRRIPIGWTQRRVHSVLPLKGV